MAKACYAVEYYFDMPDIWISYPSTKYVNKSFAKGFLQAIKSTYPSDKSRIINLDTGQVIEVFEGNNKVHLNNGNK